VKQWKIISTAEEPRNPQDEKIEITLRQTPMALGREAEIKTESEHQGMKGLT
jgi:hypothetical protein